MGKLKIGLLYLALHNQLKKKYGENTIISRREFIIKVGRHFILPKSLRPLILNEMEQANLLLKIDRDHIKILPCDIDLEKNQYELYQLINL